MIAYIYLDFCLCNEDTISHTLSHSVSLSLSILFSLSPFLSLLIYLPTSLDIFKAFKAILDYCFYQKLYSNKVFIILALIVYPYNYSYAVCLSTELRIKWFCIANVQHSMRPPKSKSPPPLHTNTTEQNQSELAALESVTNQFQQRILNYNEKWLC